MRNMTVTVEHIRGGQPRPYADNEYEAYLTFSVPDGQLWASKAGHSNAFVKPYVRLMVHSFVEGRREWHEPWLEKMTQVEPGRWHIIIKSPYLD